MRLTSFCFLLAAMMVVTGFAAVPSLDGGDAGAAVLINEVLYDTGSGGGDDFDTDGNGTVEVDDEFVELMNDGSVACDISSWEIWDESFGGLVLQFPGAVNSTTTMLQPGAVAAVVIFVDAGGSLPAVAGSNLIFDAGIDTGAFGKFSNGGENIALINDLNNYVQIGYTADGEIDFTSDGDTTARFTGGTQIGGFDGWPAQVNSQGNSQGRLPDGSATIQDFGLFGTGSQGVASPGALNATVPVELSVFHTN